MNFRTLLVVGAFAGALWPASPGRAQPPEPPPLLPGEAARIKMGLPEPLHWEKPESPNWLNSWMETPLKTLQYFVANSAGSPEILAYFVSGTQNFNPAYDDFYGEIDTSLGLYRIRVEDGDTVIETEGETAKAAVAVTATHPLGMGFQWQEKLNLKQETAANGDKVWRLVPQEPEAMLQAAGKVGVLQQLVNMLAYPEQALAKVRIDNAMSNVKELSLGIAQYVQDYDLKFPLTPEMLEEKLQPYVKSQKLFIAPGVAKGPDGEPVQRHFSFNPKLAGVTLDKIESPAETVVLYLGEVGHLDYRYGGRTVIGFVDGHVAALMEEETKKLKWTP